MCDLPVKNGYILSQKIGYTGSGKPRRCCTENIGICQDPARRHTGNGPLQPIPGQCRHIGCITVHTCCGWYRNKRDIVLGRRIAGQIMDRSTADRHQHIHRDTAQSSVTIIQLFHHFVYTTVVCLKSFRIQFNDRIIFKFFL